MNNLSFPSIPYGNYLDGFVVFSSDTDTEISIPFSGFVGDWTNLPVLEDDIYSLLKNGKKPVYISEKSDNQPYGGPNYTFTHLSTSVKKEFRVLGEVPGENPSPYYSDEHLVISPNGDEINDYVRFYGTFLRSYKDMTMTVKEAGSERAVHLSVQGKIGIKNFFWRKSSFTCIKKQESNFCRRLEMGWQSR